MFPGSAAILPAMRAPWRRALRFPFLKVAAGFSNFEFRFWDFASRTVLHHEEYNNG
jgi:hypothetical protein